MATQDWKRRAISATRQSRFGAILCAALGEEIPAPHFSGKACITSDSFVMCNFIDDSGRFHSGAFVGAVSDLESNANGLSTHLGLTACDVTELRDALRAWVGADWRSRPGLFPSS